MSGVEIAESVATVIAAGVRMLDFPCAFAPKLSVIAEAKLSATDVAVAVSTCEYPRDLLVCKGHWITGCIRADSTGYRPESGRVSFG